VNLAGCRREENLADHLSSLTTTSSVRWSYTSTGWLWTTYTRVVWSRWLARVLLLP